MVIDAGVTADEANPWTEAAACWGGAATKAYVAWCNLLWLAGHPDRCNALDRQPYRHPDLSIPAMSGR